jgi:hypothetical protein
MLALATATKEDFAPHLESLFTLHVVGQALPLRLASVTGLTYPSPRFAQEGRRQPFSLHWRGPISPWTRQGTYRLEHPVLGEMELFIVPLGPDGDGMQYEAIFA